MRQGSWGVSKCAFDFRKVRGILDFVRANPPKADARTIVYDCFRGHRLVVGQRSLPILSSALPKRQNRGSSIFVEIIA